MRDFRTPEQTIRAIMEGQANAATLEYGTDLARDTYADDTPGQEPGDHTGKFQPVLANKTATAVDGVPKKGGEMIKPNPERLAGLGQKESYKGNPYLQMAKSDIIQEDAYSQFIEMTDVEFDDMIDVLTIEELNDLEEGIISGTGKLLGSAAKGVGKLALGTVKLGAKGIAKGVEAAANRMSTKGRADAAEKKLKKLQQKKKDKERLAKAKQGLEDLKGKPIPISFNKEHKTVQDSYELGSRDYWTEKDEQDLAEGKMSKAEVKKHAAAIFKMRQQSAQAKADKAASSAMSAPKSAAAKAARRDAAAAGYGKPSIDPADKKEPVKKRGRGEKDLPHIVSQLRGVVDTKDGAPSQVKFKDGTTKNVKPKHAQSWLKKHDSAKPAQKLDMYKSHDNHKTFKSYAKEAVDAEDTPKLKKLVKGLQGSSKGHAAQAKDIEKMIKDEKEVKNCGCGEDPCKTYGSKEEQMKNMQEAPGQRAWDRSSKGRAYRRLSDEEKARLLKKNELMRRAKAMKGDDAAYSTSRMRKPTLGAARQTYKGKKRTRREHNEMMEGIILGIEAKLLLENKDKCGPGEYWCTKDMKCKPIPKGMTTDKDGMLVKESFKHYEVTHKPTGKKYKVTAMHDKSAKEKARAQHGGTASRYSGTSTDDFHTEEKMAGVEYYPRMKKHGKMTDAQKKAVTAVYDKKKVDKKMSDDPHVKKAQRYMKIEQVVREYYDMHHGEDPTDASKPGEAARDRKSANKLMKHDLKKGRDISKTNYYSVDARKRYQKKFGKKFGESTEQAVSELYPSHNTGTIDMDKHATPEQKKARADHAKKREEFAKKHPNASTSEKMFAKLSKEEVVNELDSKTLKNYIRKAVSPVNKKSAVNLASKGGYRMGKHGDHDLEAGEKEDRKAFNRARGIQSAAKKLYKKANEEVVNEMEGAQRPVRGKDKETSDYSKQVRADMAAHREAMKKKAAAEKKPVNEISDKLKTSYIKRAGQDVSALEKLKDRTDHVRRVSLDRDDSYGHRVVSKKDADKVITKRRKGMRMAVGKLGEMSMSVTLKPKKNNMYKVTKVGDKMKKHGGIKKGEKFHDSEIDGMHDSGIKVKYQKEALSPKAQKAVKVIGIAANPGLAAKKVVADKLVGGISKGIKNIQARRYARKMGVSKMGQSQSTKPITNKASQVKHSSTPPGAKPQFEGKMQRQQHLQTTMKPLVKTLATPMAGPAAGAAAAVGALAGKGVAKKLMKAPSTIKKTIKAKTSFGPKKIGEASAAEVLKKRYASYHPDDNPQATRKLRDDEHDQPKGANVYKMHPGAKLTDRGYSKKGKMAALKKQHERRPEKYGITRESYAARIAEKMNYPKSAQADMNKMADKSDKDWWKAQDKAKQREDSNKAKINKINNMGTRHGT